MPTRGYRKGMSDSKEPLPHTLRTRISAEVQQSLACEAAQRSLTHSALVRRILTAHASGQRAELPQRNANADLLRQLVRIGNNLNQLAKQANVGLVAVAEAELRATLSALNALARSL